MGDRGMHFVISLVTVNADSDFIWASNVVDNHL